MEITEIRIKLMTDSDDRLQAFCSITFDDCFVVRDLKIIDGASGPFVAMPSRKLTSHCSHCGFKNFLRAAYCNHCGSRLREDRGHRDQEGRSKLYADIAHPINSACREMIQNRVIAEFYTEVERAKQPDYVSRYDEDYGDAGEIFTHIEEPRRAPEVIRETSRGSVETRIDPPHSETPPPPRSPNPNETPGVGRSGKERGEFGAGLLD